MVFNGNPKEKENTALYLVLQDPKDVYLVGKKLEYRCITGYHMVGNAIIECMEDQTWSQRPGTCEGKCRSSVNLSFTNIKKGFLTTPVSGFKHTHSRVNPYRDCFFLLHSENDVAKNCSYNSSH